MNEFLEVTRYLNSDVFLKLDQRQNGLSGYLPHEVSGVAAVRLYQSHVLLDACLARLLLLLFELHELEGRDEPRYHEQNAEYDQVRLLLLLLLHWLEPLPQFDQKELTQVVVLVEELPHGQAPGPGQVLLLHVQVVQEALCERAECHERAVADRPVVAAEGLSGQDHRRRYEALYVMPQHRVLEDKPHYVQSVDLSVIFVSRPRHVQEKRDGLVQQNWFTRYGLRSQYGDDGWGDARRPPQRCAQVLRCNLLEGSIEHVARKRVEVQIFRLEELQAEQRVGVSGLFNSTSVLEVE